MSSIEDLPEEIILKIFAFLSLKQLTKCMKVTKKMNRISQDKSLWKRVCSFYRKIPKECIHQIVKSSVKSIVFSHCEISPIPIELLQAYQFDLTYLDVSYCDGNDNFISELVGCSKSLEYLRLHFNRPNLVNKCVQNLFSPNQIKIIDLSSFTNTYNPRQKLSFECVKKIIDSCVLLTNINFRKTKLSLKSIAYICENISIKLKGINLSHECVQNVHIQSLVLRCKTLVHLDLCDTQIGYKALCYIAKTQFESLFSLALPTKIGIEMGLLENVNYNKVSIIYAMTNLSNLKIGNEWDQLVLDSNHQLVAQGHRELKRLFPGLNINQWPNWPCLITTDPSYFFQKQNKLMIENKII